MPYTTQGYMTPADMAEVRRDMDLDLCPCCEAGNGPTNPDSGGECQECGHEPDAHA